MSELSVLIPSKTFTVSESKVTLKPFKFKQFPIALEIVEKYFSILTNPEIKTTGEMITALLNKKNDKYKVLCDICELIGLVSGLKSEEIDEFSYDEVIGLLSEIINMNMDFFAQIGKRINPETQKTGESESAA